MASSTNTLDRLRLVVNLADLDIAYLRTMRDNGSSWAEIATTVSTLSGRRFTAVDAQTVTEAVTA